MGASPIGVILRSARQYLPVTVGLEQLQWGFKQSAQLRAGEHLIAGSIGHELAGFEHHAALNLRDHGFDLVGHQQQGA